MITFTSCDFHSSGTVDLDERTEKTIHEQKDGGSWEAWAHTPLIGQHNVEEMELDIILDEEFKGCEIALRSYHVPGDDPERAFHIKLDFHPTLGQLTQMYEYIGFVLQAWRSEPW